jgi:ankyrin repeat protein
MTRSLQDLAPRGFSRSRIYIKSIFYLFVLTGFSVCSAGSYEDFFRAIELDDGPAVSTLLARGFDGNARDAKGQPGLYLAAREKAFKAAAALMAWRKIDVEARTLSDESPLMIAALNGTVDLAQNLIAKGADVNKTGWAPLHYAATRGHLQMISLLLDNYAYIDAASPNGTTPLMMAAFYGTPPAVKLLLDAGADPLLKNTQGLTAIDFAQKNSRADSAELIAASVRAKQPSGKW